MADHRQLVNVDGLEIPVKIISERRNNVRASLGVDHVILRIPKAILFGTDVKKHLDWLTGWLQTLNKDKPRLLQKYVSQKTYSDGEIWMIGGKEFVLNLVYLNRETISLKMTSVSSLQIFLPDRQDYNPNIAISKILIKWASRYFKKYIVEKVKYYNELHFHKPINDIKIKYNKSNWGSCSTGKNLNFSVRLLLAPEWVIDYVIIHELAHLVEMNHSNRFWTIVKSIMPDFERAEHDLKINGYKYDF